MKNMNCPACGAPMSIKHQFVKMVTCDFCGQVSLMTDSGLDPTGRTAKLVQLPSKLYVDATGKLKGKAFRVMGRLRYQYESGFWDEWFLTFDGDKPGWLVEDEGSFTFYMKQALTSALPAFEAVAVGSTIPVANQQVFITEKGRAQIIGGEGQLAFTVLPGERVNYFNGTSGNNLVSVEFSEDEIDYLVGRPIQHEELVVDEENYY
ncbi:MAG: DUF4178 domain-containing protein [Ardenticatenales bacterium]|nr:DUF4178 domain-containing protein [Ardenticatenales bacterium]